LSRVSAFRHLLRLGLRTVGKRLRQRLDRPQWLAAVSLWSRCSPSVALLNFLARAGYHFIERALEAGREPTESSAGTLLTLAAVVLVLQLKRRQR
jgi:hypothetical protein